MLLKLVIQIPQVVAGKTVAGPHTLIVVLSEVLYVPIDIGTFDMSELQTRTL